MSSSTRSISQFNSAMFHRASQTKTYNLTIPRFFFCLPCTLRTFFKTLQAMNQGTQRKYRADRNPDGSCAQFDSSPGPEVPDGRFSLRGPSRDLVPFNPGLGLARALPALQTFPRPEHPGRAGARTFLSLG